MRVSQRIKTIVFGSFLLASLLSTSAQAHLMVAQHGTLNVVGDGAFMVLALPISAFLDVDGDRDGNVTMVEFNQHREQIMAAVKENVKLSDATGVLSLEGIMLSPEVAHNTDFEFVTQLTVLGRFTLNQSSSPMEFSIGLFGVHSGEQTMEITGTRTVSEQAHVLVLTPEHSAGTLFPALASN